MPNPRMARNRLKIARQFYSWGYDNQAKNTILRLIRYLNLDERENENG